MKIKTDIINKYATKRRTFQVKNKETFGNDFQPLPSEWIRYTNFFIPNKRKSPNASDC